VITEWKDFYKRITLSNGGNILLEDSKAICAVAGTPCIEIIDHGQRTELSIQNFNKANKDIQRQLNPLIDIQTLFEGATISEDADTQTAVKVGKPELIDREEEKVINAPCIVHFRPKKGWEGKDYGFDWMRMGEEGEWPYKGIVAKMFIREENGTEKKPLDFNETNLHRSYNIINDKDTPEKTENIKLWKDLENIYGLYKLPWGYKLRQEDNAIIKDYYASWLSIYPKRECELRLKIYIHKTTNSLLQFDDNPYFEITPNIIDIKGKKGLLEDIAIKIKCKAPFTTDQKICVRAIPPGTKKPSYSHPLVGILQIWRNDPQYKKTINVLVVNITTDTDESINVLEAKDFDYLTQALIKVIPERKWLSLQELPSQYLIQNRIIAYYTKSECAPEGFQKIEEYIYQELKRKLPQEEKNKYDHWIKIFFFSDKKGCYISDNGTDQKINGYYDQDKSIVLFADAIPTAAVHELLHSLGLFHSFNNSDDFANAKITFEPHKTDNIMDYIVQDNSKKNSLVSGYTNHTFSLWKWQWEIVNQ
jgi:hypothetical protein